MVSFLSIVLPLNFFLAIYMAYRLLQREEKNAIFLPLIGVFIGIAFLTFQEIQILSFAEGQVLSLFDKRHTLNCICVLFLAMLSSFAFLRPSLKNVYVVKFIYALIILPTAFLLIKMGFFFDSSPLAYSFQNNLWSFQIIKFNFTSIFYSSYALLAGILISSCYWVQYMLKFNGKIQHKKIAILILQSLLLVASCIAFVYLPIHEPVPYTASLPITLCAIVLIGVYSNLDFGNINSTLVVSDIINSMSDFLIITNKDLEIVEINNGALRALKIKRNKFAGQPIFNLVKRFKIENWKEVARIIQSNKKERSIDRMLTMYNQSQKQFINLSVKPHRNKKNEIAGYVFIGKDITNIHQKEMALQEHAKHLERTNLELERFAYIASHDLKTPLRSVVSFLDLIERKIVKYNDNDLNEFVYLARQGATQMHHLIQDVLEFSKVDKVQEEKFEIDLNETVFNVCHLLRNDIDKKNGEILVGHLPTISAEKTHMTQLFTNLIQNGFKYNNDQKPTVKVNYRKENDRHLFAVSDNGIGVEQQYFDQIFDMFKRLHTSANHEGSGIGLSICKKIVDLYQGEIWLESRVNEGSTFFFTMSDN